MDTHTTFGEATDGRRLLKVTFEREGPESDTPVIEVVWQLDFPLGFSIKESVPVLTWLSTTRTDTRKKIELTPEENTIVQRVATEKAAEAVENW